MKRVIFLIALVTLLAQDSASAQTQTVLDGAYVKEHNATKRVIPYPSLREADVMYAKRIWRKIDLREKMNHPFYYPREDIEDRKNLFNVIRHALVVEGSITAYSLGPTIKGDDEFRYPLTTAKIDTLLNPAVTRFVENIDTGEQEPVTTTEPIKSDIVTEYLLKEDWIFDKQRSERYVRIIGIAPRVEDLDENGEYRGHKTLFWLYFPECRYVFANADVYNRQNDAQRRTYEDLFQQRMFSSYIVKESNVYDREIGDYAQGLDALLEAERIKEELFIMEHDLWHY